MKHFNIFFLQLTQTFTNDVDAVDPPKPVNILDLPLELLDDIFSKLDLSNAISVSKIHPYTRAIVDDMIRRMISNKTLGVTGSAYAIADKFPEYAEFQTILDLFENFGHHITKLNVHYNQFVNETDQKTLNEYISKYAAASLKEIDFQFRYSRSHSPLDGLKGPFLHVKSVRFQDGLLRSKFNFSEMFPVINNLDVGSMLFATEDFTQHLPNLVRLTTPKGWGNDKQKLQLFEQMLKLNPQLLHLSTPECDWELLQNVNKIRPDLESLELSHYIFYGLENAAMSSLHFDNMKVLKFKASLMFGLRNENINRIPLKFRNLEEIEFNRKDLSDHWIDIMMENKKMRKVTAFNALQREHLERITDGLPNLEKFTMGYGDTDPKSIEDIVGLMQRAKKLRKATFLRLGKTGCNEAAQQLNYKWETTVNEWNLCRFVRK